jgi:hypothetical protein
MKVWRVSFGGAEGRAGGYSAGTGIFSWQSWGTGARLGWAGLGWAGLGWAGLGWAWTRRARPLPAPTMCAGHSVVSRTRAMMRAARGSPGGSGATRPSGRSRCARAWSTCSLYSQNHASTLSSSSGVIFLKQYCAAAAAVAVATAPPLLLAPPEPLAPAPAASLLGTELLGRPCAPAEPGPAPAPPDCSPRSSASSSDSTWGRVRRGGGRGVAGGGGGMGLGVRKGGRGGARSLGARECGPALRPPVGPRPRPCRHLGNRLRQRRLARVERLVFACEDLQLLHALGHLRLKVGHLCFGLSVKGSGFIVVLSRCAAEGGFAGSRGRRRRVGHGREGVARGREPERTARRRRAPPRAAAPAARTAALRRSRQALTIW